MTWGGMTAFLCWGATATQEEVNAKGAWQGVRAKSSLYNLFLKESGSDADTRKAMLRTDLTTSLEIIDENTFIYHNTYSVIDTETGIPTGQLYTEIRTYKRAE